MIKYFHVLRIVRRVYVTDFVTTCPVCVGQLLCLSFPLLRLTLLLFITLRVTEKSRRRGGLPAGAVAAALAVDRDVLVLRQAVLVLGVALVGGGAPVIGPAAPVALGGGAGGEVEVVGGAGVAVSHPLELAAAAVAAATVAAAGVAAAAVAVGLAALGVGGGALVVLGLAGVGAGVGALGAAVAAALGRVLAGVDLDLLPIIIVLLDVVARHDGQLDAADGVAGPVAVLARRRLLADDGGGGDGTGGGGGRARGRGRLGRRGLARHRDGRRGRVALAGLGRVAAEAVRLGALATGRGRAVAVYVLAPLGEVEALHVVGEAGVGEAVGHLELALRLAVVAAVLVVPVGQDVRAPLTAAILALGRRDDRRRADGAAGRGWLGAGGRRRRGRVR